MIDFVTPQPRTKAPPHALSWQDIPLEMFVCAAAILLAAALKLTGIMP